MLKEFRVDNFKSLINVAFEPNELNLLIGRNNSGKTNLCQALKFVGASTALPLTECADQIAGGQFGLTNFGFDRKAVGIKIRAELSYQEEDLVFEYDLMILPPESHLDESGVKVGREVLTVTGGVFDRTVLLENTVGEISLLNEIDFSNGKENYVKARISLNTTMLHRLYESEINARANLFKRFLLSWVYYDLSPIAMKGSLHTPNEFYLRTDGSNLASMVYRLKTSNERSYRQLLDVMREIEPSLDLINFPVILENHLSMVFENSKGNSTPISRCSNGTLRFLAMAYVLLFQTAGDLRPLVIIEEPENGIYVGFLRTLLDSTDRYQGPQVIFTSHSPYFIDLFDENLDGVFMLDRDEHHTSMRQPDIGDVKSRLEQFPLGEQHFRGMLG